MHLFKIEKKLTGSGSEDDKNVKLYDDKNNDRRWTNFDQRRYDSQQAINSHSKQMSDIR